MQIISNDSHIIRKALKLTMVEMAVLVDIYQMSQNPKFNFWCVKSKDAIAEWLNISRPTVFRAIEVLEEKKYVERSQIGIRPTQLIWDLASSQDISIAVKNGNHDLIYGIIEDTKPRYSQYQNDTTIVSKCDGDSIKMILEQYQNDTQDNTFSNTVSNTLSNIKKTNKKSKLEIYQENPEYHEHLSSLDTDSQQLASTWAKYKFEVKKGYKTYAWIPSLKKEIAQFGIKQVREAIEKAIKEEYEGYHIQIPKGNAKPIQPNPENKSQSKMLTKATEL